MGNKIKEDRYWEDNEQRRKCKLCENEIESWEYVLEREVLEKARGKMLAKGDKMLKREEKGNR